MLRRSIQRMGNPIYFSFHGGICYVTPIPTYLSFIPTITIDIAAPIVAIVTPMAVRLRDFAVTRRTSEISFAAKSTLEFAWEMFVSILSTNWISCVTLSINSICKLRRSLRSLRSCSTPSSRSAIKSAPLLIRPDEIFHICLRANSKCNPSAIRKWSQSAYQHVVLQSQRPKLPHHPTDFQRTCHEKPRWLANSVLTMYCDIFDRDPGSPCLPWESVFCKNLHWILCLWTRSFVLDGNFGRWGHGGYLQDASPKTAEFEDRKRTENRRVSKLHHSCEFVPLSRIMNE